MTQQTVEPTPDTDEARERTAAPQPDVSGRRAPTQAAPPRYLPGYYLG